ncbi:MAG: TonB family protein [Acidobacteriota bacterium]|nr:TonB family protein [Acidobacteriota bacterium]
MDTETLDARLATENREEKNMLHQLIESKNDTDGNRKLSGILLTTSTAVFSVLIIALISSLFSHSLAMGSENLDITALVSPVSPPDEALPEPKKQLQLSNKTTSETPSRQANILRIDEISNEIPKTVSITQNPQQSRPISGFNISPIDSDGISSGDGRIKRIGNNQIDGASISGKSSSIEVKNEIAPPPILKQTPKAEPETEKLISGGVVNGKAIYLAKPAYPAAARSVHADGQVKVQVVIDEDGKVIAANIINGHPLLQSAALSAAKSSKFTPTTLSKQKVKVSGVIVYNFTDR